MNRSVFIPGNYLIHCQPQAELWAMAMLLMVLLVGLYVLVVALGPLLELVFFRWYWPVDIYICYRG